MPAATVPFGSDDRFLGGAIGLGLVVAALTDTCAMGAALARLPYNTRSRRVCGVPSPVAGAEAGGAAA